MPTTPLQPGATGPAVQQLQDFLVSQGLMTQQQVQTGYGTYGPQTTAAVKAFQNAHGVDSSTGPGYWGPKTIAAATVLYGGTGTSTPATSTTSTSNTIVPQQPSNDYTVKPAHVITDASGTAMFANGQDALITLSGQGATPNQIFLVSNETKQLIPFSSMQSAMNYFSTVTGHQVTPDEINASLTTIPSSSLAVGQSLNGFEPVDITNGFNEDGQLLRPAVSNANIQARYGQQVDTGAETKAYTSLDGFVKLLSDANVGSTLSPTEVTKITSDPTMMGFYINALAYGGYTLQDVYQEMVRQQAIDTGQGSQVMNSFPISTSQVASTYKTSPNYAAVTSNPTLNVSASIQGIDSSILNTPVLQLPDEAFSLINPLSDPNSPEFRQEMTKYQSAAYQAALEMASAANESDHEKATADWQTYKNEIQDKLGITLSDNAIQAWNQLGNLNQQASMNNMSGSGMVQQQIDNYLKQQSSVNQSMRSYYQTAEDQTKESYYQNYASPDEIKALIASDPTKAQAWGLVPSDEVKQYMTLSNLQSLFPDTPAADLQKIINSYLDPSGNFYSGLYSKYQANTNWNPQGNSISQTQDIASATDVLQRAQDDASAALTKYSDPNNPFLQPGASNIQAAPVLPSGSPTSPTAASTSKALNPAATNTPAPAAAAAAANLGTGTVTTPKTTTAPAAAPAKVATPAPAPVKAATPAPVSIQYGAMPTLTPAKVATPAPVTPAKAPAVTAAPAWSLQSATNNLGSWFSGLKF